MNRLTNEELRAIRERAEKATAGEWHYYPSRLYSHDMICVGDFDGQNIAEIRSRESDGEFIAHAREDIPKLLAEIETLRNELSTICPIGDLDVISSLKTEKQYMMSVIKEKDVEIERLRKIIEFAYGSIKKNYVEVDWIVYDMLKKEAIRND